MIRLAGDFDVAEEAAQGAFTVAVNQWQTAGIPNLPRAWIIQTARYKAIDRRLSRAYSNDGATARPHQAQNS